MKRFLLLIDDDEDDHVFFINELKAYSPDISVLSAFNGKEGLDILETIQPDWIFLDINMPKMNGIDVLKQIKLSDKSNNIPVYMISTSDGGRSKPIALALGASNYFKKPTSVNGFKDIFNKVFKS